MNWLDCAPGRENAPEPPALDSDRMLELLNRALLDPAAFPPSDIQELAAAVLSHLVRTRAA